SSNGRRLLTGLDYSRFAEAGVVRRAARRKLSLDRVTRCSFVRNSSDVGPRSRTAGGMACTKIVEFSAQEFSRKSDSTDAADSESEKMCPRRSDTNRPNTTTSQ